ncbi:unnamed protein product, partial [Ascophyllum nodosum]
KGTWHPLFLPAINSCVNSAAPESFLRACIGLVRSQMPVPAHNERSGRSLRLRPLAPTASKDESCCVRAYSLCVLLTHGSYFSAGMMQDVLSLSFPCLKKVP